MKNYSSINSKLYYSTNVNIATFTKSYMNFKIPKNGNAFSKLKMTFCVSVPCTSQESGL